VALNSTRIHTGPFRGGADIFAHKQFHPFISTSEVAPTEIDFPVGTTAVWESAAEIVSSGKMLAVRNSPGSEFLEAGCTTLFTKN
jgi:hypothetical protein